MPNPKRTADISAEGTLEGVNLSINDVEVRLTLDDVFDLIDSTRAAYEVHRKLKQQDIWLKKQCGDDKKKPSRKRK